MDDLVFFAIAGCTYIVIIFLALYVRFTLGKDTRQARKNTDLLVMQLIKRAIVAGTEIIEPRQEEKHVEVSQTNPVNPETKEHFKYAKDSFGLGELDRKEGE